MKHVLIAMLFVGCASAKPKPRTIPFIVTVYTIQCEDGRILEFTGSEKEALKAAELFCRNRN
jgi:hypothetical protein